MTAKSSATTVQSKLTDGSPRERLYVRVVNELMREIVSGVYPIGSNLPTEVDLCARFKASRHTVREALRQLRDAGLVAARQGSGTKVTRREVNANYVHAVSSINELMQYTVTTEFELGKWETVRADAKLALRLGCSPGRTWFRAEGLRTAQWSTVPLCWTEVFIHSAYPKVKRHARKGPISIYGSIEKLYGERITEIRQTLRAVGVPRRLAASLQAKVNTPALEIERVYKATNDRIVEIATSIHPMDRFSYSMSLRLDVDKPGS